MKSLLWMAILLLGGCGLLPAGDDYDAEEYKAAANIVLAAVNSYTTENGVPPKSLRQLMPKYLSAMPRDLDVRCNSFTSTLYFDYATSWHRLGRVTCSAKAGDGQWFCENN